MLSAQDWSVHLDHSLSCRRLKAFGMMFTITTSPRLRQKRGLRVPGGAHSNSRQGRVESPRKTCGRVVSDAVSTKSAGSAIGVSSEAPSQVVSRRARRPATPVVSSTTGNPAEA